VPYRPLDPEAVRAAAANLIPSGAHSLAREILIAASDINRLQIVRALDTSPLAAGDLAHIIARSRAATSQHLSVLRRIDAVRATRVGNVVHYELAQSPAARVLVSVARAFDALEGKSR